MNVLLALDRAGIDYDKYYASEVDKFAIQVAAANYKDTIHIGDVTKWRKWDIDWSKIGMIFAGFPCQSWSVAGQQLGDKDERGALFWDTLNIIAHVKKHSPDVIFIMENVRMKKEFEKYITYHTEEALGKVNKYLINAALVSAQNRNRFYWTNISNVPQPEDRGILLKDVLDKEIEDKYIHSSKAIEYMNRKIKSGRNHWDFGYVHERNKDKSQCITANIHKGVPYNVLVKDKPKPGESYPINYSSSGRGGGKVEARFIINPEKSQTLTKTGYGSRSLTGVIQINETKESQGKQPSLQNRVFHEAGKCTALTTDHAKRTNVFQIDDMVVRKLTPVECERLQCVLTGYTGFVSDSQRYKMLGNGFNIEVVAHILRYGDFKFNPIPFDECTLL
jgi:DNA-cytosine methyltransferase